MTLRFVFGRAIDGSAVGYVHGLDRLTALQCVAARLGLFCDRTFFVTSRHVTECTLATCPRPWPSAVSLNATVLSRRSAESISKFGKASSSVCLDRTAPVNRRS